MPNQYLLELQTIDSEADALRHRRPRLPEVAERERMAGETAALRATITEIEGRIAGAGAQVEQLEHAAAGITTKRARLDAQLKTVIAPREAEALMREMASLDAERSELDDAELQLLEEQAVAEGELVEHLAALPDLEARLEAATATADAAVAELDAQLAELDDRRRATVAGVDAVDVGLYERSRRHFGGVAVVTLQGTHCSGCHLDLSAVELDEVRRVPPGGRTECPQCGRIMVR